MNRVLEKINVVFLLAVIFSTPVLYAKTMSKPNIVIIFADDLGYGDVGCYGATSVKTPNIDRVAAQGRIMTNAHTASAVCTASRFGLMTGKYPWRADCWRPLSMDHPLLIDIDALSLPKMLQTQGYATGCIGKWHLGFGDGEKRTDWNERLTPGPNEVGFDYYFGVPLVNSHPPFVYVENDHVVGLAEADPFVLREFAKGDHLPADPSLPVSPTQNFPEKYNTIRWAGAKTPHLLYRDQEVGTKLTEKATDWIKQESSDASKPFFLFFSTTNIHHPFTPAPRFEGTSEAGRYGDFIHELDWIVGEVVSTLETQGVADNTLIIVTSDNGGMMNAGGQEAWRLGHRMNGKLLGWKFGVWEGGHRVPFIVKWPGHVEPGSRSDQLWGGVDFMATLAAITGYSLQKGDGPDSQNLLEAWVGNEERFIRDDLILAPVGKANLALREGKWLYIGHIGSGGFGGDRGSNFGGVKAVGVYARVNSDIGTDGVLEENAPGEQLYDLEADPYQTNNVVRKFQEKAAQMKNTLAAYREGGGTVDR